MPVGAFGAAEELIHGLWIQDPYRWLEDRGSPETEAWISGQQIRTAEYFSECSNLRAIRSYVRDYLDIDHLDQPIRIGNQYFYRRRYTGCEQACLYMKSTVGNYERVLVDASSIGAFASVGIYRISEDGSLLAYDLRLGGEDRTSVHFVDIEGGHRLPDRIEAGYARGLSFLTKNRGYCYSHDFSARAQEHTIYIHLFEEPAVDRAVFRVARSHGSRLILTADEIHLGALWIREEGDQRIIDLWITYKSNPEGWAHVISNCKSNFNPILKYGRIFAIDYEGARNGRLIEISIDGSISQTVIPEKDLVLKQIAIVGKRIFAHYHQGLKPLVRSWNLSGGQQIDLEVPEVGSVRLLSSQNDSSLFYSYESFSQPPTIFEYVVNQGRCEVWHKGLTHLQELITIQRASFPARDGVNIPITLVNKSGKTNERPSPVIMTGYGGFGIAMTPQFSALALIMMEFGVMFVIPHIRGGGEFGVSWHEAGKAANRQVSFDDFLQAAVWLCENDLTSPDKLAIFGGSNSGLLVGAAMTQRPELFRAVLCIAPLLDMLRYEHLDPAMRWRAEYGTVVNENDFRHLYAYSPYHQVKADINYPAALFVCGGKDERCSPAHVRKMAARLVDRESQTNSILVDYSVERGHSPVLPLSVRVEALTRRIAFLCRELNLSFPGGDRNEAAGL